jgi:hypothetical protein
MTQFYPLKLSPSGKIEYGDGEEELLKAAKVSIWRQEDKMIVCPIFPTGELILTNARLIIVIGVVENDFPMKKSWVSRLQDFFPAVFRIYNLYQHVRL